MPSCSAGPHPVPVAPTLDPSSWPGWYRRWASLRFTDSLEIEASSHSQIHHSEGQKVGRVLVSIGRGDGHLADSGCESCWTVTENVRAYHSCGTPSFRPSEDAASSVYSFQASGSTVALHSSLGKCKFTSVSSSWDRVPCSHGWANAIWHILLSQLIKASQEGWGDGSVG